MSTSSQRQGQYYSGDKEAKDDKEHHQQVPHHQLMQQHQQPHHLEQGTVQRLRLQISKDAVLKEEDFENKSNKNNNSGEDLVKSTIFHSNPQVCQKHCVALPF